MGIDKDAIIASLQKENEYLKGLLRSHNISFGEIEESPSLQDNSIEGKISLYRSYFKGRDDAYARGYITKDGKKGFAPVCKMETEYGFRCPHFGAHGCKGCAHRENKPLTDEEIKDHFKGTKTYGLYPLLADDTCYFLAIDFDHERFKECALAYKSVCAEHGFQILLEITSSGEGAHAYLFFDEAIKAVKARLIGYYLLLEAIELEPSIGFQAFDRMFPAQDYLPRGGFGNLISLPLQGDKAKQGRTLFVDDSFAPYPMKEQLARLGAIQKIHEAELDLYLAKIKSEISLNPVGRNGIKKTKLKKDDFPDTLIVIRDSGLTLSKSGMSMQAVKTIERLASIPNPKYMLQQRKRQPTNPSTCPRLLCLYKEDETFLYLPRGSEDNLLMLLRFVGVKFDLREHRKKGKKIKASFKGVLRDEQKEGLEALAKKENGLFIAPPSFGKTVVAIALIAKLKVNALVVVPRLSLLGQWKERIATFLDLEGEVGELKGSKNALKWVVDVASIDSLANESAEKEILSKYGLIIFDEAHHLGAKTYEDVARACPSKYLYGFTATLARSDGNHRIVTSTIGEVIYEVGEKQTAIMSKILYPRFTSFGFSPLEKTLGYSEQLTLLAKDKNRNEAIVKDVKACYENGRKMLLLSDRLEHLRTLKEMLSLPSEDVFLVHGSLKEKEKRAIFESIQSKDGPFLILSTGKYIGEGFDENKLDALFVATPFRWKGLLRQYVGRLHRDRPGKAKVEVYDYIDFKVFVFSRMYQERLRAYRKEGYSLEGDLLSLGKSLYGESDYRAALEQDLRTASKRIDFYVGDCEESVLLSLASMGSVSINAHSDKDLPPNEKLVVSKTDDEQPNMIVIDSSIIWYGGINPYKFTKYHDSIMRIDDRGIAETLLREMKTRN